MYLERKKLSSIQSLVLRIILQQLALNKAYRPRYSPRYATHEELHNLERIQEGHVKYVNFYEHGYGHCNQLWCHADRY